MLDNILKFKEELEQLCIKYNIYLDSCDNFIDVCFHKEKPYKYVHYNYDTNYKVLKLYDVIDVNNERLY